MREITRKKNQNGVTTFWAISIILIEVFVVVFVFYFLYYFWIENPIPTEEIRIVGLVRHHPTKVPNNPDTTGWQTYENVTYGFSFSYPAGYQVTDEQIDYGTATGYIFSLSENENEVFWLRVFPRVEDETVAAAYKRLTNIEPSIYQSYRQEIGEVEAVIYRVAPKQPDQDHVYFTPNKYFFEAPLNALTAPIISTIRFTK